MKISYDELFDSCCANRGKYSCVIFLDIDGVLNDFDDRSANRAPVNVSMVMRLKKIVEVSSADIILTSSWRMYYGVHDNVNEKYQMLLQTFDKYGLTISGKTEEIGFDLRSRPLEIRHWLMDKPDVEHFVILDDMNWHWGWLSDHVVHTRRRDKSSLTGWSSGLDDDNVHQAIKILLALDE